LSFVILNIINATGTRWSCELADNRVYRLRDTHMLVNGDDVAARGQEEIINFWRAVMNFVGLEESVGKTYLSRKFVNMNSTNFTIGELHEVDDKKPDGSPVKRLCPFSLVHYINLGLMFGIKRSGAGVGLDDQASTRTNIGVRARQLLNLSPPSLRERVYEEFLNKHRKTLTQSRLPWFIPDWLGGMGLPITENHQPSDIDLRLAHLILINWKKQRPISLAHEETTWKTREIALKRLPKPNASPKDTPDTKEFATVVGLSCINLLFDSDVKIQDLMNTVKRTHASKAIARNAKLWSPKGKKLPSALSLSDLQFQPKEEGLKTEDLNPTGAERIRKARLGFAKNQVRQAKWVQLPEVTEEESNFLEEETDH